MVHRLWEEHDLRYLTSSSKGIRSTHTIIGVIVITKLFPKHYKKALLTFRKRSGVFNQLVGPTRTTCTVNILQ